MSEPYTPDEALEVARKHATNAARLVSECEEHGGDALMELADAHTRTAATLRAYAAAEKRIVAMQGEIAAQTERAEAAERKVLTLRARVAILAEKQAPLRDVEIDARIHDLNVEEEQNGIWRDKEMDDLTSQLASANAEIERLKLRDRAHKELDGCLNEAERAEYGWSHDNDEYLANDRVYRHVHDLAVLSKAATASPEKPEKKSADEELLSRPRRRLE